MRVIATLLVVGLAVVTGCGTSISTNYDYDVNADFVSYRTYDWIPLPKAEPGSAKQAVERNDLMDKRIKNAVNDVLAEKGMTLNTSAPDVLIVYYVGVQDKVQVTDWGYRYSDYYWGWGGRDIDVYNYQEGTLILDFVDAESKKLVWRGAGKVALDNTSGPKGDDSLVRKVVGKILSQYPPKR